VRSTIEDARAIENQGDYITFVSPLDDEGGIREEGWRLNARYWERAGWGSCLPMAVRTPGIDAATWRPRGRRPGPGARSIKTWVDEWTSASRQSPIGRITRPIIQVRKDSIVIIIGTQPVSAFPGQRSRSRSSDGFAFIDCPGAPSAPYTIKLPVKLGKRTLYDGGVYPPQEYPRRSR
jgi:hypothetical protein